MSTEPEVVSAETLTPQQSQLLYHLNTLVGQQLGKGVTPYEGTVVPGMPPELERALRMQETIGTPAEDRALAAAMDPSIATDLSPERYLGGFEGTYEQALEDYWNKYSKRKIAHEYGSGGGGGTMEELLASSYATDVALPAAQARWGAWTRGLEAEHAGTEQALARALGAAGTSTGIRGARAESAVRAGMARRGFEAEGLREGYEKWLQAQPWNNPWVSQYLGPALGTSAFQNIAGPSAFSQYGQLGTGILSAAAGMKPV